MLPSSHQEENIDSCRILSYLLSHAVPCATSNTAPKSGHCDSVLSTQSQEAQVVDELWERVGGSQSQTHGRLGSPSGLFRATRLDVTTEPTSGEGLLARARGQFPACMLKTCK